MVAATSDSHESHIVEVMHGIYLSARQIKGPQGSPKDRLSHFERDVTKRGRGVWMQLHDMLRTQLIEAVDEGTQELKVSMQALLETLSQKLDTQCSGKEVEGKDEAELREKLQKALVLAKEKLACEVRPAAVKCFGSLM
ncbi:hypothetical protein LTR56_027265 [Elasticomyces elasticus]|nr:hypothetical protein LTR56_027265 [Elasticomyces elasticus]